MLNPEIIVLIVVVFLLAGTVKGVIGLGLPTISLALLSVATDLPSAMALLLVPSFITNVWQVFDGGNAMAVFKRIWLFLSAATITVWFGALALTRIDWVYLSALLGVLIIIYALLGLTGFRLSLNKHQESRAGPLIGIVNGVLTGMTGSFVVPGVMFLQAIGLSRDALIQAMGMLFTASTLALAFALGANKLLSTELATLSLLAVLPALVGMFIGRKIRQAMSEQHFRKVFFIALLILGGYILASG